MLLAHALRATKRTPPSFVSSSTNRTSSSTTVVVSAPAGIQDGDLLVAVFYASTASVSSLPSGFTAAYTNNTANNPRILVGWKRAASESGSYTFTAASTTNVSATILVYRNASFNTVGAITRASSTTVTASSISPSQPGILIAAFSTSSSTGSTTSEPSGMTLRANTTGSASAPSIRVYDQTISVSGATGDRSITFSSSATLSGILIAVN